MNLASFCVVSFVLGCALIDIVDTSSSAKLIFRPVLDAFVEQYVDREAPQPKKPPQAPSATTYTSTEHGFSVDYPSDLQVSDVGYAVYFQEHDESKLAVYIDSKDKFPTGDSIVDLIIEQRKNEFGGEFAIDQNGSHFVITNSTQPDWIYRITFKESDNTIYGLSNMGSEFDGYEAFVESFRLK